MLQVNLQKCHDVLGMGVMSVSALSAGLGVGQVDVEVEGSVWRQLPQNGHRRPARHSTLR